MLLKTSRLIGAICAASCLLLVMLFFSRNHLKAEDALYLAKNSIKRFWNPHPAHDHAPGEALPEELPHTAFGKDVDMPFSSVVNSMFPVDLIISYNNSNNSVVEVVARYASFSVVSSAKIESKFHELLVSACSPLTSGEFNDARGKIIFVRRGNCSFVDKISNVINAQLSPKAVIIVNNEPQSGLLTMFSTTFNRDGSLRVPFLFMTLEDFEDLAALSFLDPMLSIRLAPIDSFLGLVLLMALSPPLMIFMCYMLIRGIQMYKRRHASKLNKMFVKLLPVYIFQGNVLIPTQQFYDYLSATNQTNDIPLVQSSIEDLETTSQEADTENPCLTVGDIALQELKNVQLLFAGKDYYNTQKCSICLGRFHCLKSRVLLLECRHLFHEKCLTKWLVNFKKSCPLCNDTLTVSETRRLSTQDHTDYGAITASFEAGTHTQDYDQEAAEPSRPIRTSTSSVKPLLVQRAARDMPHERPSLQLQPLDSYFTAHESFLSPVSLEGGSDERVLDPSDGHDVPEAQSEAELHAVSGQQSDSDLLRDNDSVELYESSRSTLHSV